MDFTDKELKVLLQALYRYRGEVSGASQSEQNRFGFVASVISKIESKVGPIKAETTGFDREMAESLSVLTTGRAGAARAKAAAALDKGAAAPKVKSEATKKPAAPKKATKPGAAVKAAAGKSGGAKTRSK